MVEAPAALEAAGCLCHAAGGNEQSENLPARAVEVLDMRKASEAQAGRERAQRKQDGARQRPLPKAKDRKAETHNLSMYRDGRRAVAEEVKGK